MQDKKPGADGCTPALIAAENRIFKSLKHNLEVQSRLGTSKHQAKLDARDAYLKEHGTIKGWNPSQVDGIFGKKTMDAYIANMRPFARFCASQGAKRLSDVTEQMGADYLVQKDKEEDDSAWSISQASSSLNKAMGWHLFPSELGLKKRRKEDIHRSRLTRAHDNRDFSKYEHQITFAKGTGVRRTSVTVVCPTDCVRNKNGTVVGVHVTEKGGRHRIAPVLNAYREAITTIANNAIIENGEDTPIFDSYDVHIDNHRFRAEYAATLLHQLEEERAAGRPLFGGAFKPEDYCHLRGKDAKRKVTTAGHDTDLLGTVSGALGHNRVEIVLRHYLYLY